MRKAALSLLAFLLFAPILYTAAEKGQDPLLFNSQSPSSPTSPWWNADWHFRTNITLTSSQTQKSNQTLLVFLQIPYGHSVKALNDLRLVNQQLREIPSAVLYEQKQSIFTIGAAILFTTTIDAGASVLLDAYYGNPTASPPQYRQASTIQNYDNGLVNLGLSDGQASISYRGEPYTNFYTTKFRYNNTSQNDYGAIGTASRRIGQIAPWQLEPANNATFTLGKAGDLTILRVLKPNGKNISAYDLVVNNGTRIATNLQMVDLLDARAMATRGLVTGAFNATDDIAFASVGSNFLGIKGDQAPVHYNVGLPQTVYIQTLNMALSDSPGAIGDVAIALQWNLSSIQSGGYAILSRDLTFEGSYANLTRSLSGLGQRPNLVLLGEEPLPSPLPTAATLLTNQLAQNISVGPTPYTATYSPASTGWIVTAASLTGTATYAVPGLGDYDFESPTIWSISPSDRTSNTVTFASSKSWSEERGSYTAAIRLWDNDTSRSVQGSVSSKFINVVGAQKAWLSFAYRLINNFTIGQSSAYIALLTDTDLDNVRDSTFYVSGTGTLPSSNSSATLLADGAWRNTTIDLSSLNLPGDFRFAITLFEGTGASGTGARGVVEVEFDNISLRVEGAAQDILSVKLDPYTTTTSIAYSRQGVNTSVLDPAANITLSYTNVAPTPVSVKPKGEISINFPAQTLQSLSFLNQSVVVLGVQGFALASLRLNDTPLATSYYQVTAGSLIIFRSGIEAITGRASVAPFDLALANSFWTLRLEPRDANMDPVQNVAFTASDSFGRNVLGNVSGSSTTDLTLIPFAYNLQGVYHGVVVYSGSVDLGGDTDLVLDLPVFRTTFTVRDVFKFPITGTELRLERNSTLVNRSTTDSSGKVSVQLASNAAYVIRVFYQGELLLEQGFTASLNNLNVDLGTSYTPFITRIAVAATIIAAALIIIFLSRRRIKL